MQSKKKWSLTPHNRWDGPRLHKGRLTPGPLSPCPQGHWGPVGSWVSILTPQRRAGLVNTLIPHSPGVGSTRGKQSPSATVNSQSTPSVSALVEAGSAGNWHCNSNLQKEMVNIQPTNGFYFCYRRPGVWSRGNPRGHVNIQKHPTFIHFNRKPSWFKNNNNN